MLLRTSRIWVDSLSRTRSSLRYSLVRFVMALLRRCFLMLMTSCRTRFGNWKQRNLGRRWKSDSCVKNSNLIPLWRALIEAFSNFRRSVMMVPPGNLAAMSWIKFPNYYQFALQLLVGVRLTWVLRKHRGYLVFEQNENNTIFNLWSLGNSQDLILVNSPC